MMTTFDSLTNLRDVIRGDEAIFKKERWITGAEAEVIATLIRSEDIGCYFECGTANGFSAAYAAATFSYRRAETACTAHGNPGPIHTWDPVNRPKVWALRAFEHLGSLITFHNEKYNASIKETVPLVRQGKALFFIDGEHTRRYARNDIRNTMRAASPGDVMVLHDLRGGYEWLTGRFKEFERTHRTEFYDTERGMGAVWLA